MSSLHGVQLDFVCGTIPVVTLDSSSPFNEHVSNMIQAALDSSSKADGLYEYCDDKAVYDECRRRLHEDVMLACVKRKDLRHVRAAGFGKRSVMFAVSLALALDKKDALSGFWSFLKIYNLDRAFRDIMNLGKPKPPPAKLAKRPAGAARKFTQVECHGVTVDVVCENIPVVGLEKDSLFQESASWLLQAATSSMRKADSLYAWCSDKQIMAECRQLGFSKDEVFTGKLNSDTMTEANGLMGVGVNGKRSLMLALVISLVLSKELPLERLLRMICQYDASLRAPLKELISRVMWPGTEEDEAGEEQDEEERQAPMSKRARLTESGRKAPLSLMPKPSEEELKARDERRLRFEASGGSKSESSTPVVAKSNEMPMELDDGRVKKEVSTDATPLQGSCTDLEKPYLRLTTLPKASDLRPEPVLRQAFARVCEKWAKERNWVHACEMLRSIRQDLTVQMIRNSFTVEVYEFCARAALDVGDFKQFDQCSTQLVDDLHCDRTISRAGTAAEFLASRLLFLTLQGNNLHVSTFLCQHKAQIQAALRAGEPHVSNVWKFKAKLAQGNLLGAQKMFKENSLSTRLLQNARLKQLAAVCSALKPAVSQASLDRLFPPVAQGSGADKELPVVFSKAKPGLVDGPATIAEAEKLLGKPGVTARVKLGEVSSDHMKGFVRA